MRSGKAPTISARVMTAKVIWQARKTFSGMLPEAASVPMPQGSTRLKSPIRWPPSPNASEYAQTIHRIDMSPAMAKHCIITESTFTERTRPA